MTQLSETQIRQWRADILGDAQLPAQILKDRALTLCTALLSERTRKPDNLSRVVMEGRPRLTRQQIKVLRAIMDLTVDGMSPTLREIANHIGGKSCGPVSMHIDGLVEKGFVIREPKVARSLRVLERVSE